MNRELEVYGFGITIACDRCGETSCRVVIHEDDDVEIKCPDCDNAAWLVEVGDE